METTAKASLSMYRQSPRKVRLVASAIRGKAVTEALQILQFSNKRSAEILKKLLESAVANAKSRGISTEGLIVSKLLIDGGPILYRRRPRARGSAAPIRKRTSHVSIFLSEKQKSEARNPKS